MKIHNFVPVMLFAFLFTVPAWEGEAGEADVVDVRVREQSAGVFSFDVTLKHADEGWKHYADAFEITGPDGAVLGTRTLLHPHVDEQPFTRSLGRVRVPAGLDTVGVRGRDLVHGLGGKTMQVPLPGR